MKFTLLLLVLVAVIARVAYAAPQDGGEIQELIKALQQQDGEEKNEDVDIQSLLAGMQDDDEAQIEAEEAQIEEAALQEFFAREQIPVKLQGWLGRFFKKVRKIGRKIAPYIKTGYKLYKAYKKYQG